jgi:hypothetical protein
MTGAAPAEAEWIPQLLLGALADRLGYCFDVAVLENETLMPVHPLDRDVQHGPRQIVGPNHQVGEHHPKRRANSAQQAVAEIRFPPRLDGIDVGRPEDVNARKCSCEEQPFRLSFVASEGDATLTRRVRAISA